MPCGTVCGCLCSIEACSTKPLPKPRHRLNLVDVRTPVFCQRFCKHRPADWWRKLASKPGWPVENCQVLAINAALANRVALPLVIWLGVMIVPGLAQNSLLGLFTGEGTAQPPVSTSFGPLNDPAQPRAGTQFAQLPPGQVTPVPAQPAPAAGVFVNPPQAIQPFDPVKARSTAVALNYSRASLHRIRKNPSVRVTHEEQTKILNHLDFNGVADEEVVKLYSSILDEVGQQRLADQERTVLTDKYQGAIAQSVTLSAFTVAAQLATASYPEAIRTGAASWWDYRTTTLNRDLDLWRVEKARLQAINQKSIQFLETSWRLARTRQIPDTWLVRSDDLDQLELAWAEPDLETRLRRLKRTEPFMEAWPPYHYYVARTEQGLGRLAEANETYEKLAKLQQGHFRKDEMLAASLANQSAIQTVLGLPEAPATARKALAASNESWESHLLAAAVLQRAGEFDVAEEAILRNLDSKAFVLPSQVALLSLYCSSGATEKLQARLADATLLKQVPVPVLVACSSVLADQTPPGLRRQLMASIQGMPKLNFGADDYVIAAQPNWNLEGAKISLEVNGQRYGKPQVAMQQGYVTASFGGVAEWGHPLSGTTERLNRATIVLEYPQLPPIRLALDPQPAADNAIVAQRGPRWQLAHIGADDSLVTKFAPRTESMLAKRRGNPVQLGTPAGEESIASSQPAIEIVDIIEDRSRGPINPFEDDPAPAVVDDAASMASSSQRIGSQPVSQSQAVGQSQAVSQSQPVSQTVTKPPLIRKLPDWPHTPAKSGTP